MYDELIPTGNGMSRSLTNLRPREICLASKGNAIIFSKCRSYAHVLVQQCWKFERAIKSGNITIALHGALAGFKVICVVACWNFRIFFKHLQYCHVKFVVSSHKPARWVISHLSLLHVALNTVTCNMFHHQMLSKKLHCVTYFKNIRGQKMFLVTSP